MNILLINENPVVTKLVTLSAQKTGDELEVVSATEQIHAEAYDVLIFDSEQFDPVLYDELVSHVSFAKKIYMGNRDIDKPDAFDVMVNKPFLPTDLVDLFTDMSQELQAAPEETTPFLEEDLSDEEIDLDALGDENEIDLDSAIEALDDNEEIDLDNAIEALDDNEEIDLDSAIEALSDEHESDLEDDMPLEDLAEIETDLEATDELLDASMEASDPEASESHESILDKEELEEVQALLEDPEEDDALLSEVSMSEEELLDGEELSAEAMPSDDEADALPDVEETDDLHLMEESLEDAVEHLSDEELNAPIDEETLLNIVNEDKSTFDEFDALDINAVRSALGETPQELVEDQCDRDALEQVEEALLAPEPDDVALHSKTPDPKNGIEALQTVLKALQNDEVAHSLKAMNITINISFGEQ